MLIVAVVHVILVRCFICEEIGEMVPPPPIYTNTTTNNSNTTITKIPDNTPSMFMSYQFSSF